jgi:catechol 2,3-dioxygenase
MATQRLAMHLDHVCLESEDPEALAGFYGKAAKMDVVDQGDGIWTCEAVGRRMMFSAGRKRGIRFGAYAFADPKRLGAYRARLSDHGFNVEPASSFWFGEGAFAIRDPDGNRLEFGVSQAPKTGPQQTSEARLQHFVVATDQCRLMRDFYVDVLGFQIADEVYRDDGEVTAAFLNSGDEHHAFAVFQAPEKRFDHQAFEVRDWNDIRDWADHLSDMGVLIDWGPGRHGIGNNLFIMIADPDGNWFEYSAEIENLVPDRQPGRWKHEPRTLNLWGQAVMRS